MIPLTGDFHPHHLICIEVAKHLVSLSCLLPNELSPSLRCTRVWTGLSCIRNRYIRCQVLCSNFSVFLSHLSLLAVKARHYCLMALGWFWYLRVPQLVLPPDGFCLCRRLGASKPREWAFSHLVTGDCISCRITSFLRRVSSYVVDIVSVSHMKSLTLASSVIVQ
jgi:hypothetical protein